MTKRLVYIKHGTRYMGICDLDVYNNAPRTRYGNVESTVEELPYNYYYGDSAPCEYKVLKHLSKHSCIAEMTVKEFIRITRTLKCENIRFVAYLSTTGEYI